MQAEPDRQVASIDVAAIGAAVRASLAGAIAAHDLPALLRVYDRKGVVLAGLAAMKGIKKDSFVGWAMRAIKAATRPELRNAVGAVLQAPTPR